MNELITLEQMRNAIKRAVEERGADYVYEKKPHPENEVCLACHYNHPETGEPDCLIGLAFSYLRPETRLPIYGSAYMVLKDIAHEDARLYASSAQRYQDDGYTWGEALAIAEAWLAEQESNNETI